MKKSITISIIILIAAVGIVWIAAGNSEKGARTKNQTENLASLLSKPALSSLLFIIKIW